MPKTTGRPSTVTGRGTQMVAPPAIGMFSAYA